MEEKANRMLLEESERLEQMVHEGDLTEEEASEQFKKREQSILGAMETEINRQIGARLGK